MFLISTQKRPKPKKKSDSSTKPAAKPKTSTRPKKKEFVKKQAIQSTSIFEAGSGAPKTHRNDFRSPSLRGGPSESKIASLNRVTAQLRSSAPYRGAGDSEADDKQENLPLEELLKQIDLEGDTCIADIGNQNCFLEDVHNEQSSHHGIDIPTILEERSMERLIEFKLPDKLPSQPVAPASQHQHQDSGNQNEGESEEIGEGYLGKIQILKSGRCQLIIGNYTLEIHRSVVSNSYKEAVAIRPHETRDKGTFTRIGQIAHALDCYPTIDQI